VLGGLGGVGGVDDVAAGHDAEVAADRTGERLLGVGRAQHLARTLDGVLALPHLQRRECSDRDGKGLEATVGALCIASLSIMRLRDRSTASLSVFSYKRPGLNVAMKPSEKQLAQCVRTSLVVPRLASTIHAADAFRQ
jgi:hypothetical protein